MSYSHRRTWNLQDYQPKEESVKQGKVVKKKKTQNSSKSQDLINKLKIGKINIVNPNNLKNAFYCAVCDVLKYDSMNYLSHMNSKNHMKNVGKDLVVNRSTLSQVQERLNAKKEQPKLPADFPKKKKQKLQEPPKDINPESSEMEHLMGFSAFGTNKKH